MTSVGHLARIARIAGIALGAAAGVAGTGAMAALRLPLPRTSGALRLPGLSAPVEILRDRWGIPHIYAHTNDDLFMAQGYIHAQDRLWQMEFQRRIGHGRLAEIFGVQALEAAASCVSWASAAWLAARRRRWTARPTPPSRRTCRA